MKEIHSINDASFGLRRALAKGFAAEGLDVTPEEWTALSILQAVPGLTVSELAARAGRDKTTTTRMLDRLVGKGLAERRNNPNDRRVARLFLGRKGYETWEALQAPVADAVAQTFDGIDGQDVAIMQSVLDRMVRNLRQDGKNNQPNG